MWKYQKKLTGRKLLFIIVEYYDIDLLLLLQEVMPVAVKERNKFINCHVLSSYLNDIASC